MTRESLRQRLVPIFATPAEQAAALMADLLLELFGDQSIHTKLDLVILLLRKLFTQKKSMSVQLDALTAQVTQNTTVEESAVTLINGLVAQIKSAGTDPGALKALTDSLTKSSSDLAAAVAANTPAAA